MRRSAQSSYAKRLDGFTIVEMMMVLAAAGLILLIVFLALPNLQRNSHNSQRKQDAATILQAISRYELNNSGTIPANFAALSGYTDSRSFTTVTITPQTSSQPAILSNSNVDTLQVYNHYRCNTDGTAASSQGAGYRDVVGLFGIEVASGTAPKCIDL